MNRFAIFTLVAAVALAARPCSAAASRNPALVPMPREVRARSGKAQLGPGWVIVAASTEDRDAAQALAREAQADFGWVWRIVPARSSGTAIELRTVAGGTSPDSLHAQGYWLEIVPHGIRIEGGTAQGRFYGVQTLRQLMRGSARGRLGCVAISDWPALCWRGVSDDISRGQISTAADFQAVIEQLAYYKLNLYQPYIEDVFASDAPSGDAAPTGRLTPAMLAAMVEIGRRNHVAVCPIFESLTHQQSLPARPAARHFSSAARPEAGIIAAWWALFSDLLSRLGAARAPAAGGAAAVTASFSTRSPGAIEFVQNLIDPLAAVTRGPFFHIGGDEWEPARSSAAQAVAASDTAAAGYGRFVGSLADHLQARFHLRTMLYGDVALRFPSAAATLPRDLVIVDWRYDPSDAYPSLDSLRSLGFRDVMVSPGLWNWRTFYPNYARALRNIASFAQQGKRAGALGCVVASWGDDGAESLRENNWPGYAYAAAAAWQAGAPDTTAFLNAFVTTQFGSASPSLARAERLLGWQEFSGVAWAGALDHRPLVLRPRAAEWRERMRQLRADMHEAQIDLALGTPAARFGRSQLDAAAHAAHRFLYLADRELLLDSLGTALAGRRFGDLPASMRDDFARELERLQARSAMLNAEYGALWLRSNQPGGLADNQARLERQGVMLGRLLARARSGALGVDSTFSGLQSMASAN
jgi:hypothetical protein